MESKFPFVRSVGRSNLCIGLLLLFSTYLPAQCCTDNVITDAGFEISINIDEKFPNATISTSNNAETLDPTNWSYVDGDNSLLPTIINDATRATEGDQFVYIPNPSSTPAYNKCIGNDLSYTVSYSCQNDYYTTGVRYLVSFDYMAFDKNDPTGGTTSTQPKFEYNFGSFTEVALYDDLGNELTTDETAVAWSDVASSWNTAYGLIPATSGTGGGVLWFSHDRFGTCGMLMDNTNLKMIELSDHGMSNIAKGANSTEITFSLNPDNNVLGVPNLSYEVIAPSGYTVSPSTGLYNVTTNFTLTINTGDMLTHGSALIDLIVRDEVNTDCSVTAEVNNLYNPDNDAVSSLSDLDDDNDGISDAQELCGTDPSTPVLSTAIDVTINLDNYPTETSWDLTGPSGVVASGGPYTNGYRNLTLTGSLDVSENGAYAFNIYDSFGDGLDGNTYAADGDDFALITESFTTGSSSTINFNVTSINPNSFSCLAADPLEDSDNDGTINYQDSDFCTLNANGVCVSMDADGDGIINSFDRDSDNDGIPDIIEAGGIDTNGDGIVDSTTDADNDGLIDIYDADDSGSGSGEVTNGAALANVDTDSDGLVNALDLDADNDGIPDLVEVNGIDTNGDGRVDSTTDVDEDGFADIYDPDDDSNFGIDSGEEDSPLVETNGSGAFFNSGSGNTLNTDSDSYADYVDLDADNDGIPDIIEAGASDPDHDGKVDTGALPWDADGDGLADIYDENTSDGPSGTGTNGTALIETSSDTNGDGLVNASEQMIAGGSNKIHYDADGIANHLDIDADDDGITDVVENASGAVSADNGGSGSLDGRVHNFIDTSNDGWNDASSSATSDRDSDGIPDFLDIDADNDGIADYIEGVCTACPTASEPSGNDGDGDGLLDLYETLSGDNTDNVGGSNQGVSPNFDDDDLVDADADYLDTDSDEDGSFDWNEGFDNNGDGSALDDLITIAANYESANGNPGDYTTADSDTDGIPDWADNQIGVGYDESSPPPFLDPGGSFWVDSNSDGLVALFDAAENGTMAPTPNSNSVNDDDWRDTNTSVALPVDLISFTVSEKDCQALIQWTTAQAINADYFSIEYTANGQDFIELTTVPVRNGNNFQEYNYTNTSPDDWAIYRLKIIDEDGSFEYSDWQVLETSCTHIALYPNPLSQKAELTIDFKKGKVPEQIEIFDELGRSVLIMHTQGATKLNISGGNFSNGLYFLNLGNNSYKHFMIID